MDLSTINDIKKANDKEKANLTRAICELQKRGYKENLSAAFDYFYYGPDKNELHPHEIFFDEVIRFENSSDPDDQSILYAISAPAKNVKGLYVESYGLYHDNLSPSMIERIKFCHDIKNGTLQY